jgi:homeobox protein YOX1/YHP1
MPDRYQGSYDAVVPHVPNYGDIRSSPTTYPTEYIPHPSQMSYSYPSVPDSRHHSTHLSTVHHSQQMSYSTAERGLPTQVEAQGPYPRGSITNTKLTEESAPVMANEEPTINEIRNAVQLAVLNDNCTHTSLSSTEEHAKLVRLVYTPVRVTVILIPLIGFRTNSSQLQVLEALARFLH